MLFYVLDSKYQTLDIIDTFTEAVWNVFFRDEGNCSIYLPAHLYATDPNIKAGNYLMLPNSDRYMIIEDFETKSEIDEAPIFIVNGRSLESILDRRVVWSKITFEKDGKIQDLIKQIVTENLVDPEDANRKIDGFVFEESSDEAVTSKVAANTYEIHGENVLEVVRTLCSVYDLGFKVVPNGEGGFKMSLYAGLDRSYSQDVNPWVVFSPKYENLEKTSLVIKNSVRRNSALVYNEYDYSTYSSETGMTSHHEVYAEDVSSSDTVSTGLDRREIFVQCSKSHTKDDENNTPYTREEYTSLIREEGKKELAEHQISGAFSGKIEAIRQFAFGKDFNLGDIVQVENEYGMVGRCRVAEVAFSQNSSGERTIPYFSNVGSDEIMN